MQKRISEFYAEIPRGRGDRHVVDVDNSIDFDGEKYVKVFENNLPWGYVAECVRPHETIETWTKLVTIHRSPNVDFDFRRISSATIDVTKSEHSDAFFRRFETSVNPILVFQIYDPSKWGLEFNVFAFARHESKRGTIAFQFSQRFTKDDDQAATDLKRQRALELVSEVRLVGFDPLLRG